MRHKEASAKTGAGAEVKLSRSRASSVKYYDAFGQYSSVCLVL